MNGALLPRDRSPLEIGGLVTLVTYGLAALFGVIAVFDADHVASAFGTGVGVAFAVFLTGSTIACALACLKRRQLELVSLGSIVASGVGLDLLVLAIWLDIENEAYGKIAGIAFVWSFFALIVLGLTLAVGTPASLARSLYLGAVAAATIAGLISTWLVATAGDEGQVVTNGGGIETVPYALIGNDELLRALGAMLVLLSALWFGALAASRLDRPVRADA